MIFSSNCNIKRLAVRLCPNPLYESSQLSPRPFSRIIGLSPSRGKEREEEERRGIGEGKRGEGVGFEEKR